MSMFVPHFVVALLPFIFWFYYDYKHICVASIAAHLITLHKLLVKEQDEQKRDENRMEGIELNESVAFSLATKKICYQFFHSFFFLVPFSTANHWHSAETRAY